MTEQEIMLELAAALWGYQAGLTLAAAKAAYPSAPKAEQDWALESAYLAQGILTALEASRTPEGMVLVPREPTMEHKLSAAQAITSEMMAANANYDAACACLEAFFSGALNEGEGA